MACSVYELFMVVGILSNSKLKKFHQPGLCLGCIQPLDQATFVPGLNP